MLGLQNLKHGLLLHTTAVATNATSGTYIDTLEGDELHVLVHLGTEKVPRLRVGIGRPGDTALHDHVLGMFENDEMPAVTESVTRASDAFEFANAHGMDAAMNQFNQRNQEP